jgi:hypothetical protein
VAGHLSAWGPVPQRGPESEPGPDSRPCSEEPEPVAENTRVVPEPADCAGAASVREPASHNRALVEPYSLASPAVRCSQVPDQS